MKSNVSDLLGLVHAVYLDACAKCTANVSDLRDLETIKSRVEKEGLSFLTITLPDFCKDFERSLANRQIDSTCFRQFRKHGTIPVFLQGMFSHLFDRETGRLLNETDEFPTLVEGVRQICLLFKKVQLPCSDKRNRKALANFIEVEQSFNTFKAYPEDIELFARVSDVLWSNMLGVIRLDMLVPRHGPGATAERIMGNQKYVIRRWHERLEPYFPLLSTAYSISAGGLVGSKELKLVTLVPKDQEDPVRVVLVPKTLKSPRIIAIEPVCVQYTQQAIQAALYEQLESYWLTKGHVNFRSQSINQKLAMSSSRTGRFATIDLSDASDRVPRDLALLMFNGNLDLRDAVDACRSRSAVLPDGTVLPNLEKFASMGSALCFPVESMYFYTICVAALLREQKLPVTPRNVYKASRVVWVYGDDIVVPSDKAEAVIDHLKKFNCKVNNSKSFWTGRFRESCGVDAYAGSPVTPVYLRRERPINRKSAEEIVSWAATAHLFYLKGYWHAASLMYSTCERALGKSLPYVSMDSPSVGRISFLGFRSANGWNEKHQSLKVKGWVLQDVYRSDRIDGYSALQKCLLSLERRSRGIEDISDWGLRHYSARTLVSDPLHLERTSRRGAVVLRHRWVPVT